MPTNRTLGTWGVMVPFVRAKSEGLGPLERVQDEIARRSLTITEHGDVLDPDGFRAAILRYFNGGPLHGQPEYVTSDVSACRDIVRATEHGDFLLYRFEEPGALVAQYKGRCRQTAPGVYEAI